MHKNSIYLISFVLLLCQSGLVQGTDYYVSPSGSDSNAGTSSGQAWKTIGKVNSTTFGAGDSIFFEGGQTFSGSLYFDTSDGGTPGNPLAISSYGSGRATISSGTSKGFFAYNRAAFKITDLVFVGAGRTVDADFTGILFYTDLNGGVKLEYVRVDNVDVSEYRERGIQIGAWNESNSGFKDVRITNSQVHDNGCVGIESYDWWPPQPSNRAHQDIYVGDCEIYNNAGIPGREPHSGNGIVLSGVDGAIIEYCEAYNNGWLCDAPGGGPLGIWTWEANDVVIQFCESHDNKTAGGDGGGFDIDGGCTNSVMQYNYSYDNEGCGYLICQFDGASAFTNNVCRYNISENDAIGSRGPMGAIHFWSSGSSGGIQDTQVYGNTVYVSSDTRGAGIEVDSGGIYNSSIHNNIITTVANKRVVDVSTTSGGWAFQGNCYWTYSDNIEIRWGGSTYTSLAAWRSATSQETLDGNDVGFECDPCLVNPGNGGTIGDPCNLTSLTAYKLQSNSSLINAGLDIQTEFGTDPGLRDYYGTAIPSCYQFDVGAHEYYFSFADFDCDEGVNFFDYTKLAGAWMSSSGEPDFNDHYDLYDDDTIDIPDLGIFSDEWLWGFGP